MFSIVISANRAGDEEGETLEELSCSLLVAMGWLSGITERSNMDCIPKKWSPCLGRDMHSICGAVSSVWNGRVCLISYLFFLPGLNNKAPTIIGQCLTCTGVKRISAQTVGETATHSRDVLLL